MPERTKESPLSEAREYYLESPDITVREGVLVMKLLNNPHDYCSGHLQFGWALGRRGKSVKQFFVFVSLLRKGFAISRERSPSCKFCEYYGIRSFHYSLNEPYLTTKAQQALAHLRRIKKDGEVQSR